MEIQNFSSSVEKCFTRSLRSLVKYFFQHEKRNFVSPSGHVMFYLLLKYQWNTKPFDFNSFFDVKGAIYYEAMATVIFSHVKISEVSARKLTWYFIGVYIIKCNIFPNINDNIKYDMIISKHLPLSWHFGIYW